MYGWGVSRGPVEDSHATRRDRAEPLYGRRMVSPYPPSNAPSEKTPEPQAVVDTSVEDWRFRQLILAGWTFRHAEKLAEMRDVDLHRACNLLTQGCDEQTAWEILT